MNNKYIFCRAKYHKCHMRKILRIKVYTVRLIMLIAKLPKRQVILIQIKNIEYLIDKFLSDACPNSHFLIHNSLYKKHKSYLTFINRPGIAWDVLQTPLSINSLHWFSHWCYSSRSSKHQYTQTVKARGLNFERMFTPHHVLHVRCQVSDVTSLKNKWQISGASRWRI